MSDFRPGDIVERYRAGLEGRHDSRSRGPSFGSLVTVSAVKDFGGVLGIQFHDWPNPVCPQRGPGNYFWDGSAFRHVYRPDPLLIDRLLAEPVFAPPVRAPDREKVAAPSGFSRPSPTSRPLMARELFAVGDCSR